MNISASSASPAANLLNQAAKVRSFYADPVEALGAERSRLGQVSHQTREQADSFSSQADSLGQAQASLKALTRVWSQGQLGQLQEIAAQVAAEASANPFASIALNTRQGLASVLGGKRNPEEDALEGAVVLAGAMGTEPAKYADNLNQALQQNYYGLPAQKWVEGEVTPTSLEGVTQTMASQAEVAKSQAEGLYQKASQEWGGVDGVQKQLNTLFATRRNPQSVAQRIEAAKTFVVNLHAEAQANPQITKEMRELNKELKTSASWIQSDSLLASYNSQLAKSGGDLNKVDWKKLLGQMERTSFG